ncbi:RloB family protein [Nicoliella lavandulae]|uniref:RloB family protein n=1 Tax=Nicoliella lavandulae TaxID=3082954 RepID=A0ABU8SME0_9LACO
MSRYRRNLKPKPKIYFFVEGETESVFFKALKKEFRLTSSHTIKILNNGSGNLLEKTLKQLKESSKYPVDSQTKIFIIFDRDNDNKNKCLKMIKDASKKGIKIGLSNISFEVWLLAHYKYMNQSMQNEKNLENELSKQLGSKYKKADPEQIKSIISDNKVCDAIKNTDSINKINEYTIDEQCTNIGMLL